MKFHFTVAALLILFPSVALAQYDKLEAGIYTILEGEPVPLVYTKSKYNAVENTRMFSIYKGESSGLNASDTFILVAGHDDQYVYKDARFGSDLVPNNLILTRFTVDKNRHNRFCETGNITGLYTPSYDFGMEFYEENPSKEFRWKKIGDNSFLITLSDPVPGEYAFTVRVPSTHHSASFYNVYAFTIPGAVVEDEVEDEIITYGKPSSEKKYDKVYYELVFGYIQKSWTSTYNSGTVQEGFFGVGDEKVLHGAQGGFLYTPSYDWGLGLRTGFIMEFYESRNPCITEWCRDFTEFDIYIPVQASYRIPFEEQFGLTFFGGAGFQYAICGFYTNIIEIPSQWGGRPTPHMERDRQEYRNGWPKEYNIQAEIGLNLRYKIISAAFTYSYGLINHNLQRTFDGGKTFETASRSRQDKIQITLAVNF